ncbi:hypothetical protein Kfla_6321 [Kribbella flavida DSM 17836]|uniref:Biopolymer transporter Tol n=1 Tax=Kribbella flavida (strain DSM 17836 / JCM 10339 / NBRC 14399) TaxID=479435 RepID=D2PWU3_KRIFD|nr:hypothetical protein [Kribbella flavida]ADB35323.1 hypothetical protein Kfla_6321 [Kribbella flavida DSM 17836]
MPTDGPPRTPDGHHVVIAGRKWRATDPAIPPDVRSELQRALMAARRAVGAALRAKDSAAERQARTRVQTAKVALGERGVPWWEQTEQEREHRWTTGLRQLTDEHDAP